MEKTIIDLSKYNSDFTLSNKMGRIIWNICYWILFRPLGLNIFNGWRNFLLKVFGAKIGKGAIVHASVKIWAPWNLKINRYSCIGGHVDCYNQGMITIGENTTISQKTYLCASSHDISSSQNELILRPIIIHDQVWIAADAFIGPGVTIGQGAVVGARSAVFKNIEPWTIVGGNPAVFIKNRLVINENQN